MMRLSFKDRIAFYYMSATAILMALVFGTIYFAVKSTVMSNLDSDLSFEAVKHTREITFSGDSIRFINKDEWEEREHSEIQVNPVFIQLINKEGRLMDKSPNLKQDFLPFNQSEFGGHFDSFINSRTIRQVQLPVEQNGKIKGYILAAMSSESAFSVILKLRNVLLISYVLLLVGLYFVSRFLAGRSIVPVQQVTNAITRITRDNLKERVDLPEYKDEIFALSTGFNALIERIEKAMDREKQFTSDASHELRTPLATLRGTLEVLIRKPRTEQEYKEKIQYSLKEIDRMTAILDQLLLLARLDAKPEAKKGFVPLPALVDESISHFSSQIANKNLRIDVLTEPGQEMLVPNFYSDIIIENILGNAVKYSRQDGTIRIKAETTGEHVVCTINDEGIGIREEDLVHLYENFFRSDALEHKHISGNGLGLSIVRKCADAIAANVHLESTWGEGTTATIFFLRNHNLSAYHEE